MEKMLKSFEQLKPFEKRLIEEYCELRERYTKLKDSLETGDEFKEKVGEKQYGILLRQYEGMDLYFKTLGERIDDLGLRDNIPTVWGKDSEDDEMLSRDKVITKAYTDCLEEMYQKAQPSASYIDYVNMYRKGELTDKDHVYERHYLPQSEYEYIVDKYVHAYGMDRKWDDYVDTVVEYLNEGATKDKWIEEHEDETGYHPGYRGYEKLEDIAKIFEKTLDANKDKTNEELAMALKALVLQRIDYCKNFYRFDREEGDFKASVALGASPTSNHETVRKYWEKEGVELTFTVKDPDTLWERDYYGDAYDDYLKEMENEIIDEE